jgi:hypothetical protein
MNLIKYLQSCSFETEIVRWLLRLLGHAFAYNFNRRMDPMLGRCYLPIQSSAIEAKCTLHLRDGTLSYYEEILMATGKLFCN